MFPGVERDWSEWLTEFEVVPAITATSGVFSAELADRRAIDADSDCFGGSVIVVAVADKDVVRTGLFWFEREGTCFSGLEPNCAGPRSSDPLHYLPVSSTILPLERASPPLTCWQPTSATAKKRIAPVVIASLCFMVPLR